MYREGEVLAREEQGAAIRITVRLPVEVLGRLKTNKKVELFEGPPAART
jgi:hypothetical protein